MTTTSTVTKPTTAFWLISIFAVLWNIMGVVAYMMEVTMTPEDILAMPVERQSMYTNVPTWATCAFALATWGSLLASVLLLLRKKLAGPLFVAAFAATLIFMCHNFFMTNMIEVDGFTGMIMPICIIAIGAFLIFFSRNAAAKGWLA